MKRRSEEKFNWQVTLLFVLLSGMLIGVWLFTLAAIAIETFTREEVVLFHPSEAAIVVATFLMLLGVTLLSIQIARILEHLFKG